VNYPFKLTLTNVHISPFLNLTLTLLRSLSPFVIHQHSLCSPKDKHHLVLNLVTCNIHRKEFDVGWDGANSQWNDDDIDINIRSLISNSFFFVLIFFYSEVDVISTPVLLISHQSTSSQIQSIY